MKQTYISIIGNKAGITVYVCKYGSVHLLFVLPNIIKSSYITITNKVKSRVQELPCQDGYTIFLSLIVSFTSVAKSLQIQHIGRWALYRY